MDQQLQRAFRAGQRRQPRSAKEGGKGRGGVCGAESIKGVIRRFASQKRRERDRDGWRRRRLPEGGETNCRNLCRSGARLLTYSLPFFFFLPPQTSSFLPSFFPSREPKNLRKKGSFRSFSFSPPPSLPHLSLFRLFPPNSGRSFPPAGPTGSEHLGGGGAGFL